MEEMIKPARSGRRGGGLTHRFVQMFFDSSCTAAAATDASHLATKRHEHPLHRHCKRSSGRSCHCQQRLTAPVPRARGAHEHPSCERRPSSSPTRKLKPSSSSSMCSAGSSRSDVSSGSHPNRSSRRNGEEKVSEVIMERGVALVKNSSDPYADFRSSMAEMIAGRVASTASEDMEGLLRCYLSLNSPHHHAVIMEAFVDIWEAMLDH